MLVTVVSGDCREKQLTTFQKLSFKTVLSLWKPTAFRVSI